MRAEPGRCPSAVALLAPVLSSCASGFLVHGLGLLRQAWAWQGECVKASPAAEPLEAFLTRGLPPAPTDHLGLASTGVGNNNNWHALIV